MPFMKYLSALNCSAKAKLLLITKAIGRQFRNLIDREFEVASESSSRSASAHLTTLIADLWMFEWGREIRFAGKMSHHSGAWEANWKKT